MIPFALMLRKIALRESSHDTLPLDAPRAPLRKAALRESSHDTLPLDAPRAPLRKIAEHSDRKRPGPAARPEPGRTHYISDSPPKTRVTGVF
jgi:hypothetical protein